MRIIILFVLLFLGLQSSIAQIHSTIPSSGNSISGTGGSLSYSMGQIGYTTYSGTNGSLAQGIQQPYEISALTGSELYELNLVLAVFPNPTSDVLNLSIGQNQYKNLYYQLMDINGRILLSDIIQKSEITLDMSKLGSSTYFLKIMAESKEFKIFKIQKN